MYVIRYNIKQPFSNKITEKITRIVIAQCKQPKGCETSKLVENPLALCGKVLNHIYTVINQCSTLHGPISLSTVVKVTKRSLSMLISSRQ